MWEANRLGGDKWQEHPVGSRLARVPGDMGHQELPQPSCPPDEHDGFPPGHMLQGEEVESIQAQTEEVIVTIATKEPTVDELIDDIVETRKTELAAKIRPQEKRPYMYLSDIHQCSRHNFYSMTEGDKRKPVDDWLQGLFDAGKLWEDEIVRELTKMRFEVIAGQQSVEVKYGGRVKSLNGQVIGRGRIDGMIRYRSMRFPMEIKSMGENKFRSVNTIDDLFKVEYTEKYLRQILLYLYGNNLETGLFILTDRSGHWKLIPVCLGNYLDYVEKILRNMEATWEAKAAGKEPDRIP